MMLPSGIRATRIVVIGLGGIGSWLTLCLARTIQTGFALIDPDTISPANLSRQLFLSSSGHKVDVFGEVVRSLTGYSVDVNSVLISPQNVGDFIRNEDVIFVCPDNHACRVAVADYADSLRHVVVFTAGNEAYTGSCHAYVRMAGVSLTKPLRECHPDVYAGAAEPTKGVSCSDLMDHGNYQILTTNFATASLALQMYFLTANCHSPLGLGKTTTQWPQDGWVDILTGNQRVDLISNDEVVAPRIVNTREAACV